MSSAFGIAFRAVTHLDCANGAEAPATGVFRKPLAGAIGTVALQGEPSEPTPMAGGTVYDVFPAAPGLSSLGAVAFEATTTGLFTGTALYLCDPTGGCPPGLAAIAVAQGDSDGSGRTFFSFSGPGLSDAGDMGFGAKVRAGTGALTDGLYIRRSTASIETVARPGDPVARLLAAGPVSESRRPRHEPGRQARVRRSHRARCDAPEALRALRIRVRPAVGCRCCPPRLPEDRGPSPPVGSGGLPA